MLYTAQYRYPGMDRLDITVKGQDRFGKFFAPTWNMVSGFKKGVPHYGSGQKGRGNEFRIGKFQASIRNFLHQPPETDAESQNVKGRFQERYEKIDLPDPLVHH